MNEMTTEEAVNLLNGIRRNFSEILEILSAQSYTAIPTNTNVDTTYDGLKRAEAQCEAVDCDVEALVEALSGPKSVDESVISKLFTDLAGAVNVTRVSVYAVTREKNYHFVDSRLVDSARYAEELKEHYTPLEV